MVGLFFALFLLFMAGRHLLSTYDLTVDDVKSIVTEAHSVLTNDGRIGTPDVQYPDRRVVLAFYEASTRTRISFETAAQRLGITSIHFQATGSSVEKGESLLDTMHTLDAMDVDAVVLRHGSNGAHASVAAETRMSVINAGEGTTSHPTQALLDVSAILERRPSLAGCRIGIVGDIRHSRVARSQIDLFRRLGASVVICGPETMATFNDMPNDVEQRSTIDDVLEDVNILSMLRIQFERLNSDEVPSLDDYRKRYALTTKRLANHKDVLVIHPGPVNVGIEVDADILTSQQSLIRRQVTHGVAVRMAVLSRLFAP